MPRTYTLKRRAEQQAETRRRIVDAAIDLHSSLGPAQTTISMVAERAGVQRHTVYAHFPDEKTLLLACSAETNERDPPPEADAWRAIADRDERLRAGAATLALYPDFAFSYFQTAMVHVARGALDRVQQAFLETGAVQCGFCTPGLIVATHDLLARTPQPSDAEIREALAGNLCRCTGYEKVLDAVRLAAGRRREGSG